MVVLDVYVLLVFVVGFAVCADVLLAFVVGLRGLL